MYIFQTAVEWLLRQSRVIKDGAGVIGTSKGAEMAMLTAYVCKKVNVTLIITEKDCCDVALLLTYTHVFQYI